MKQVWLLLLVGVVMSSGCVGSVEGETAVIQPEPIQSTLTPTNFPTVMPEIPRPDSCPITQPPSPRFVPPKPYSEMPPNGEFWYGSNALWTTLWPDGTWHSLPKSNAGYGNKVVWFREGYVWTEEEKPQLAISARRLDGEGVVEKNIHATNGFHPDYNSFMLTGIELPTLGCWEITGEYESHTLSFVVWVAP